MQSNIKMPNILDLPLIILVMNSHPKQTVCGCRLSGTQITNHQKPKIMKRKILFLLILVPIVMATSCKKDEETDPRDNFVATYNVSESWSNPNGSGTDSYQITITKSAADNSKIIVSNFADFSITIDATISGTSMTIPQQSVTLGSSVVGASGSGSLSGSVLNYSYTLTGSTGNLNATCIATKR